MKRSTRPAPLTAAPTYQGSVHWRHLVDWLREDEVITPAEADRTSPAEMMRGSAAANREIPGMVQLYSTLVSSALDGTHPAAHDFVTERFARLRSELGERVRALQASGALRADVPPDLVAALVIAASDGLQTQWLPDGDVDHEAALALLDRLLAPPHP